MRVLVRSPLTPYTGYGNDGIGMTLGFHNAGSYTMVDPATVQPPLPQALTDLFLRRVDPPFDMFMCHADPANAAIEYAQEKNSAIKVFWSMWEYSSLENMDALDQSKMYDILPKFDFVVAYDSVTAQAFGHFLENSDIPAERWPEIVVQTGGFIPGDWVLPPGTPNDRSWSPGDPFRFCMVGQLGPRKNPFASIQAFKELKDDPDIEFEDAELHLKTNVSGLHPLIEESTEKLKIHYVTWPQDVLRAFMANCHVLLAPSKGEGKNMPALEMMALGGTTIATNWGGHTSWLSPEYAYPLDYELKLEPGTKECYAAKADVAHLKELMLHCYQNRDEVRHKGEIAARTIPKMQNWDSVIEAMMGKLAEVNGLGKTADDLFHRAKDMRRGQ